MATLGSLALMSTGHSIAGIVVHALPIPYQVFASIAAWRSANRYGGAPHWAHAAKAGIVVFGLVATIL